MLNKENIRKLTKRIKSLPSDFLFDMGKWTHRSNCGTVARIAGHAALIRADEDGDAGVKGYYVHLKRERESFERVSSYAAEWMGLSNDAADALFLPRYIPITPTRTTAIRVLEWLAELDHDPSRAEIGAAWTRSGMRV